MKKITLVMGGIRSGKSVFAEQKALYYSSNPIYIATALDIDEEMKERIEQHKQRRGSSFQLIEEARDITKILFTIKARTVVVDCLTLNLSNRLLAKIPMPTLASLISTDEKYWHEIKKVIVKNQLNIIFVANEVGQAPIASTQIGRYFQDLQGRWNRWVAEMADEVYLINAGIPRLIKKKNICPFKLSAPSYLVPRDYIENVIYLMDKVNDIQLLLLQTSENDPLFHQDTLDILSSIKKETGLSYSVHMQIEPSIFEGFSQKLSLSHYTIEQLLPLDIGSFTFHFDLPPHDQWEKLSRPDIDEIYRLYRDFFFQLKKDFPTVNISLENTQTPLGALDPVVSSANLSYCIDIGHLLMQNRGLGEIPARLKQTSVIHIHGLDQNGKDHQALAYDRELFALLEKFTGIVTIENFNPLTWGKSRQIVDEYF